VFVPELGAGDVDPWQLPGVDSGRGEVADVGRTPGAGTPNRPLVPYRDVLGSYRDAATRTIEGPSFPATRRELVRGYFDRLAE
jgi:hypothetical protein